MHWTTLAEVPEAIRNTLSKVFTPWDKRDLTVEGTLTLVLDNPRTVDIACRVIRAASNAPRVPALCDALRKAHPAPGCPETMKSSQGRINNSINFFHFLFAF